MFDPADQLGCDAVVDQHIIRGNAGLPHIDQLAPDDPLGRRLQIGRLIDDDRAFTAELQRDRDQIFGGGFHHDFADRDTSRKENIIELGVDQLSSHLFLALDYPDISRFERLPDHVFYNSRDSGSTLGRLQHSAIPGGDSADQRLNQQLERIIERSDNQHGPVGLAENQAFGREHMQRGLYFDGLRPAFQVLHHVPDAVEREADLRSIGFEFAFVQVLIQSGNNPCFVAFDGILQLPQLLQPEGNSPCSSGVEKFTGVPQHLFYVLRRCFEHPRPFLHN
ncbi:hypothetical protein D3C74_340270 [compost metagenome]